MGFCINSDAKDVVLHKKYERCITFNKAQVAKSMQCRIIFHAMNNCSKNAWSNSV